MKTVRRWGWGRVSVVAFVGAVALWKAIGAVHTAVLGGNGVLTPSTSLVLAIGVLVAGVAAAFRVTRAVPDGHALPNPRSVKIAEVIVLVAVLLVAALAPHARTTLSALGSAVLVLSALGCLAAVGQRHNAWHPDASVLGRLVDSVPRAGQRRVLCATALGAAAAAGVLSASGVLFLPVVVGVLAALAPLAPHRQEAKADAIERLAFQAMLAGYLKGGRWTVELAAARRIPLLDLDLDSERRVQHAVIVLPPDLGEESQERVGVNLTSRCASRYGGKYVARWDTGKQVVILDRVSPLPEALRWEGIAARGNTVTLGVGLATKEFDDVGLAAGETFPFTWDLAVEPHGIAVGTTGKGKSQTVQLILAQLLLTGRWSAILLDPKMVEFSQWLGRPGVVGVYTSLEEMTETLEMGAAEVLRRMEAAREAGVNHVDKLPVENRPKRLLLVVDEVTELLKPLGAKNDAAKAANELKARAAVAIGSILRLGRSAGVHLLLACQRADRAVLEGEAQNNLGFKILQGKAGDVERRMIGLTNVTATPGVKGRAVASTDRYPECEVQVAYIDLDTDLDLYLPVGGVIEAAEIQPSGARVPLAALGGVPDAEPDLDYDKPGHDDDAASVAEVQVPGVPGHGATPATPGLVPARTLADVGGYDDLKARLLRVATLELLDPEKAAAYGITTAGVVLHGVPGTGKTFLAECLAGSMGARFRHLSGGDLVGQNGGDTVARLRANFDAAIADAQAGHPAVILLDELDSVAPSREGSGVSEWGRLAVTELLVQIDRVKKAAGVLVIATTNHISAVDPAVLRDGRLEEHLRVDLPDLAGREQIIEVALAGRPVGDVDVADVARRTPGYTASALVSLINAAATSAARENRDIATGDLVGAWERVGGQDRPTVEDAGLDSLVLPEPTRAALQGLLRRLGDRDRNLSGKRPTGLLLYGPSGTGKTSIAKAIAAEAGASFYPVRPGELMGSYWGETERNIRALFERARQNAPSIVFFDEMEGIAGTRADSNNANAGNTTALRALLAEMDGFASQAAGGAPVFVIGATNRPEDLDPAMLRTGRLSTSIEIGLPDAAGRLRLLEAAVGRFHIPCAADADLAAIVAATEGWAPADVIGVATAAEDRAYLADRDTVTRTDFGVTPSEAAVEAPSERQAEPVVSTDVDTSVAHPVGSQSADDWLQSLTA